MEFGKVIEQDLIIMYMYRHSSQHLLIISLIIYLLISYSSY